MAIISVFMLLSFCLFFVLTRMIWIRLIKYDELKVEIHLPIIAIVLSKSKEQNKGNTQKKRGRDKDSSSVDLRIILYVIKLIDHSKIKINHFSLPKTEEESKAYLYNAAIFTALAYLKSKSQKLILTHDALVLFSDSKTLELELISKIHLYRLIRFILPTLRKKLKVKYRKRMN